MNDIEKMEAALAKFRKLRDEDTKEPSFIVGPGATVGGIAMSGIALDVLDAYLDAYVTFGRAQGRLPDQGTPAALKLAQTILDA